jgi:hypothetical protein
MWCGAVSCASEEIKKHGGKLEVKMEAKEVGQREDAELQVHTHIQLHHHQHTHNHTTIYPLIVRQEMTPSYRYTHNYNYTTIYPLIVYKNPIYFEQARGAAVYNSAGQPFFFV